MMCWRGVCLWVSLALAMGCAGAPPEIVVEPAEVAVAIELHAELIETEIGERRRYLVPKLPRGHGYQPGRVLALFGPVEALDESQPIGLVYVVEAHETSLELGEWLLEGKVADNAELTVGPVPEGEHFGKALGRLLADTGDARRVRINMGADQAVEAGDLYQVLGDPVGDADIGGRTLGRPGIGLVQVVAVEQGFASAVILEGQAPKGMYVVRTGHDVLAPRPVLVVLLAKFEGELGDAYSRALRKALESEFGLYPNRDIVIKMMDQPVSSAEHATQVGRDDWDADIVLWGSASPEGENMAVWPEVTFIDARWHDELGWEEAVKLARKRVYSKKPDEVARRVQGLASYLAGLMYYVGFRDGVESWGRAAGHFRLAVEHGEPGDADVARTLLFFCLRRIGDWSGAERIARTIEHEGRTRSDEQMRAQGLHMLARNAHSTGSWDEALDYANEAIVLFDNVGDVHARAGTMGVVADIYYDRGNLDDALRIRVEEVLPVYDELGDIAARARAIGKIADIYYDRGDLDEDLRIRVEEQLPVYDELGDTYSRAVTMSRIAAIYSRRGELDEALRIYEEDVLPVVDELGDIPSRAAVMSDMATIYYRRGDLDEALRIRVEEVLPILDELGDIRNRARIMGEIADIYYDRGNLDEAIRIRIEEELPVYDKLRDIRSRAVSLGKIAEIYSWRGDLDEAIRIYEDEVIPTFDELGDVFSHAVTRGKIADIYHHRGDLDEALRIRVDEELPVYDKFDDIRERAVVTIKIADIYYDRGNLDEAIHIYEGEVLPALDELVDLRARAAVMDRIAGFYHQRGDLDEAIRIYKEEVLPPLTQMNAVLELIVAKSNLGFLFITRDGPGDREQAAILLETALATARQLQPSFAQRIEGLIEQHGL